MQQGGYLELDEVLTRIEHALSTHQALSLVRIGDGENLVLAQDTVWPVDQVLQERWAIKANLGQKGLFLPNLKLRDEVAYSLQRADIVGILPYNDISINAPSYLKRELTDQVFSHFGISPLLTCHACLNRQLVSTPMFWNMLKNQRLLIVTREDLQVKSVLESPPYTLHISHTIPFGQYEQMSETLRWIVDHKSEFDVALFTCGVNAVVLAERTATLTGKVAFDFGKASNILIKGRAN